MGDFGRIQGTLTVQGATTAVDDSSYSVPLPSSTPVTVQYNMDPGSLAIWPSRYALSMLFTVNVYDVSPLDLGFGSRGRSLISSDNYPINGTTLTLPDSYGDNREIDVTAQVMSIDSSSLMLGSGG